MYDKTIRFEETTSEQQIFDKIYVNDKIPAEYRPDMQKVADYLFEYLPKNTFWTLDNIWFVTGDKAEIETLAAYVGEDGEWVEEVIVDTLLGRMWFLHNAVIINIKAIIEESIAACEEDREWRYDSSVEQT